MNLNILYRNCPTCGARSVLMLNIDNDLPLLSPSGGYSYFCPHCLKTWSSGEQASQEEKEQRIMTSFKREVYHVGGADVISYELTDAYAHTIQLTPQETLDLLTWLDTLKGQLLRDMHPEVIISELSPDDDWLKP